MGDLGSGSGSSYPGALDTQSTPEVNSPNAGKTKARAEVPNDIIAATLALETELGPDPAGTKTDVATYLQTEHNTDGTHDNTIVVMMAGAQTISGIKTLSDNPIVSNASPRLTWFETGVTAENGRWEIIANGEQLLLRATTDNGASTVSVFTVDRTGTTVDNMDIKTVLKANDGIQTDGTNTLKTKIMDIGDWDMVATTSVTIAHGLTFADIRQVSVLIISDDNALREPIDKSLNAVDTRPQGGVQSYDATNVNIDRLTGGSFDDVAYDSTSFNRGYITITYVV